MALPFTAGQPLTAQLLNSIFTEEKDDTQNTAGTVTSTTYTESLTGGTACSTTFTAPRSGKIEVVNTCELSNSGAGFSSCSYVIRTGSSIGLGTVFLAAAFEHSIMQVGTPSHRKSVVQSWSGLTPGATYNIRQAFRVQSNTGTFSRKFLSVKGLT